MTLQELSTKQIQLGKAGKEEANFIDELYSVLKQHYIKQHRDWYINERFVRGEHWSVFNKATNQIQTIPTNPGEVRRTVNKVRTQVRGVKNFIKRNQPRWRCSPNGSDDSSEQEAIRYNKILQDVYETQKFPSILTDVIVNSLKYSIGIVEGGLVPWNDGKILDFWVDDTFDIFIDPEATCIDDARFILKVLKKSVTGINGNKNYTKDGKITADNREAGSDYKDQLEKEKFNTQGGVKIEDLQTALFKELWLKSFDSDGKVKIRKISSCGGQVLKVEDPNYRRLPFFTYNPEKQANNIYSDPWIKDLIPLNKSLDKAASMLETYQQRAISGKWLAKRGVEVSSITDKGSEIITYKGNTPPEAISMPQLTSGPFTYMQSLERWIEEFGGIRQASLGEAPGSLQSGKGLEALQSADAATVAEPIENLEIFLSEIGEFTLEVIADNLVVSSDINDKKDSFSYIGESASIKPSNVIIVSPRKVKVTIVPELAYSEEAKQETVFKLAEANLIDGQTVLEYLNVSNISDILERMNAKKTQDFQQEMVKQNAAHSTGEGQADDTATLADQENMKMASGQQVPMTPKVLRLPEHTQLHEAFMQENADAYQQNKQLFDDHVANEKTYQQ